MRKLYFLMTSIYYTYRSRHWSPVLKSPVFKIYQFTKILCFRSALIAIFLFMVMPLAANYSDINQIYNYIPNQKGFPIVEDGKWGFIDEKGKVVIKPKYDRVNSFSEGKALVSIGKNEYFIDMNGNIALKTQYNIASNFSDGLAVVSIVKKLTCDDVIIKNGEMIITYNAKTGCIDSTGKLVIPFGKRSIHDFHYGYAIFNVNQKMYYNEERCYPIKCNGITYNNIKIQCSCGIDYGQYGLIDKKGNIVIQAEYSDATYSNGIVCFTKSGKYKYLDLQSFKFLNVPDDTRLYFSEGLAEVRKNGKSGYIDKTGKLVIKYRYYYAGEFSEGLAKVYFKRGGGIGFINTKGEVVIEPRRFDSCKDFHEGVCAASAMGKWGYINREGKWLYYPKYGRCLSYSNGLAVVSKYSYISKGKSFQYVNMSDEIVWQTKK